ncbi:EF-hand domain-containing protein [Amycolatopsis sp. NPDC059657]|uniref:EF-hand domain-containing protein n=1 Tax=Amycolatopsis sp. NPDC059657 TaxID=3346899 RepID=UPI0036722141
MLSELQIANLSTAFDVLDVTRDGALDRDDFEKISESVLAGIERPAGSIYGQAVRDGYLNWWEQIREDADGDGDGRVSKAEYLAAVDRGLLHTTDYLDAVTCVADALFTAVDTDGDGCLSHEEMGAIYASVGIGGEVAAGAFAQIDTDHDGRITSAEWRAAIQGVFMATIAEEPGSNMLGNA